MNLAARLGWAEPELLGLGAFVRQGDTVLDVGASHGMYTSPLARLVGTSGQVHSFEPHPRQQRTLRRLKSLIGAKQDTVYNAAVGSEVGEFTMRLPVRFGLPIYGHAHIADGATDYPASVRIRTWKTPVTTIDTWAAENDATALSFIKIDVEGFEPSVISGGTKTIGAHLPSMLLEVEDRHLSRYDRTANQFADELRTTWPAYRMYTWVKGAWALKDRVDLSTRNYLFATDAAFARP
jgi:FkbM family methyltransferase